MAKLTMFIVCDSTQNLPVPGGMVQQLISPQVVLRPQFVPGNFSFGVAVGVQDVNLHIENRIRFTIKDPSGKIVQDSNEKNFPPLNQKDTLPSQYQGFMLNLDIRNLPIESEGEYLLTLYLNGDIIGECIIPIFKKDL